MQFQTKCPSPLNVIMNITGAPFLDVGFFNQDSGDHLRGD